MTYICDHFQTSIEMADIAGISSLEIHTQRHIHTHTRDETQRQRREAFEIGWRRTFHQEKRFEKYKDKTKSFLFLLNEDYCSSKTHLRCLTK